MNNQGSDEVPKEVRNTQKKRVYERLKLSPATRRMLAEELQIFIGTVCSIVHTLKKVERCEIVRKDKCAKSGFSAQYLTTNSELFRQSDQYKLDF